MTRFHRITTYALWAVTIAIIWFLFSGLTDRVNDAENLAHRNAIKADTAKAAVGDLASQVRDLGGMPVVEPSELPTPEPGDTGPAGPPGETVVGPAGKDGQDGQPGATVIGPPGPSGQDGETVVGPAGADGKNGSDGAPGAAGADGAPGPAGPAGYPDSFTFDIGNGRLFECRDPDGDHAYTCTLGG